MDHDVGVKLQLPSVPYRARLSSGVQTALTYVLSSACALFLVVAPAIAQSSAPPTPENASAKRYGEGWECNIGFRRDEDTCNAVVVPANAYETNRTYGLGWECLHGYRADDNTSCVEVIVPDGGFLDPSGKRWHCSRGYLKVDDICQEIALPANAYLSVASYRSGWRCERGFEVSGDLCTAIVVPENAFLNGVNYGRPWTCERGFFEQDGECAAVVIPMHAYFDESTYSAGWRCERGYAASDKDCEAIDIPANAHLDRSGNRWECDRNFQNSKGQCVLDD
jgi:hypothetical protein